MSTPPVKVEKRLTPRYIVYRDCSIVVAGGSVEVTLLNVSKGGLAFLGPEIPVSVGDRIEACIEGVSPPLTVEVSNINYGRVGGKFDLEPEIAELWSEQFDQLVADVKPME